jgi:hypothetical protein
MEQNILNLMLKTWISRKELEQIKKRCGLYTWLSHKNWTKSRNIDICEHGSVTTNWSRTKKNLKQMF